MGASVALIDERPSGEATYRNDADRLWRAVSGYAGDADVASESVAEAIAQILHRGDAVGT